MTPDMINGCFEFIGSLMCCLSIRRLYLDKTIKGVSLAPVYFWTAWGLWNMYFYPSLNAWCSFIGGCFVVTANIIWLSLAIWYNNGGQRR